MWPFYSTGVQLNILSIWERRHLNLVLKFAAWQNCRDVWNIFFFSNLAEIWLKNVLTRRKWRTRNIEKTKYLHPISFNFLKNIVKKNFKFKN